MGARFRMIAVLIPARRDLLPLAGGAAGGALLEVDAGASTAVASARVLRLSAPGRCVNIGF
jgi:hypothetical protein